MLSDVKTIPSAELSESTHVERVVIVGSGGHGSELQSYLEDLRRHGGPVELMGFIDDRRQSGKWNGAEVLGNLDALAELLKEQATGTLHFITAVGDNKVRRDLVARLSRIDETRLSPWTLRHPASLVGRNVQIGAGTCLAPGSIVTSNARIGSHCILNVNTSVSHDSVIGDFANINPGAVIAGNVQVGAGAYIGAGATLIDRVKVGEWSVIGAGAVVIDDIPAHVTAVGVPARVIKHHD